MNKAKLTQVAHFPPCPKYWNWMRLPPSLPWLFSLSPSISSCQSHCHHARFCAENELAQKQWVGFGRFCKNQLLMEGLGELVYQCLMQTCLIYVKKPKCRHKISKVPSSLSNTESESVRKLHFVQYKVPNSKLPMV